MTAIKWIVGIAFGLFVLMMIIGNMNPDPEKDRRRHAIELCWDEQGKKSNDPATARFIAGSCEMMEQEFLKKYGRKP